MPVASAIVVPVNTNAVTLKIDDDDLVTLHLAGQGQPADQIAYLLDAYLLLVVVRSDLEKIGMIATGQQQTIAATAACVRARCLTQQAGGHDLCKQTFAEAFRPSQ